MSPPAEARAVLLDTCAVIWLANGDPLLHGAAAKIIHAGPAEGIYVSPLSAWEIGLLAPRAGVKAWFLPDPATWFARFVSGPAISLTPLTWEIAMASSSLPGTLHGDPADRLLIATARHLNMPIVTRDSRMFDYAAGGNIAVIAC